MEAFTIPLRDVALEAAELLKCREIIFGGSLQAPVQNHVDVVFRPGSPEAASLAEFSRRFLQPAIAALSRSMPKDAVFKPLSPGDGIESICVALGGAHVRVSIAPRLLWLLGDSSAESCCIERDDERIMRIDVLLHPAEA